MMSPRNLFEFILMERHVRPNEVRPIWLPTPASEPIDALPGSADKVAAIKRRIEAGEELWHPEDGPEGDDD